MKKISSRSGFTLIEIIVVMIILGVVVAIALPNIFSSIERSRAQEAISNMSSIRQQIDVCIETSGGKSTNCTAATVDTPHFDYVVADLDDSGNATITATRAANTKDAAAVPTATGTHVVVLTRDATNKNWVCSGSGVYLGVCK